MAAIHHSTKRVKAAVFGDGWFLTSGCVTEMNLSQVTSDRIRTEDSQDKVLKKPTKRNGGVSFYSLFYIFSPHKLHM